MPGCHGQGLARCAERRRPQAPAVGAYAAVTAFGNATAAFEASANAEAGLQDFPDDDRLQVDMLRCYERDGWVEEALALRRRRFERWPSVDGYRELLRAGVGAGREPTACAPNCSDGWRRESSGWPRTCAHAR